MIGTAGDGGAGTQPGHQGASVADSGHVLYIVLQRGASLAISEEGLAWRAQAAVAALEVVALVGAGPGQLQALVYIWKGGGPGRALRAAPGRLQPLHLAPAVSLALWLSLESSCLTCCSRACRQALVLARPQPPLPLQPRLRRGPNLPQRSAPDPTVPLRPPFSLPARPILPAKPLQDPPISLHPPPPPGLPGKVTLRGQV